MSETKQVYIGVELHRELRELAGWSGEKLREVAERGIRAEVGKIREKREQTNGA